MINGLRTLKTYAPDNRLTLVFALMGCILFSNLVLGQSSNVLYMLEQDEGKRAMSIKRNPIEAKLTYNETAVFFRTTNGVDTVVWADVNRVCRARFVRKDFTILYHGKKKLASFRFCNKKSALSFNHLLLEKKIKYRKPKFLVQALLAPITLSQGCGDCPVLDGRYRMISNCK